MNEYQEFKAKTVDEAVVKAMEALQTSSDFLDYEVIDQGKTGFLGIGSRPVVIKARKKPEPEINVNPSKDKKKDKSKNKEKNFNKDDAPKSESKKDAPKKDNYKKDAPKKDNYKKDYPKKDAPKKEAPKKDVNYDDISLAGFEEEDVKENKSAKEIKKIDVEPLIPGAVKFLEDVFKAMELEVNITAKAGEDVNTIDIDLAGEEMGVLIGKRGQTLDSLQYLTSIIINADQEEYVRVKVDTENYRCRRKETLENLARNIAAKVKRTNKTVALEPMNPYERRIIHSALQQDKYVDTHSEGEEPYRKVVVTPNKNCRNYNNNNRKPYGKKNYHKK